IEVRIASNVQNLLDVGQADDLQYAKGGRPVWTGPAGLVVRRTGRLPAFPNNLWRRHDVGFAVVIFTDEDFPSAFGRLLNHRAALIYHGLGRLHVTHKALFHGLVDGHGYFLMTEPTRADDDHR